MPLWTIQLPLLEMFTHLHQDGDLRCLAGFRQLISHAWNKWISYNWNTLVNSTWSDVAQHRGISTVNLTFVPALVDDTKKWHCFFTSWQKKNYFGDVCRGNVNFLGATPALNLLEQVAKVEESSVVLGVELKGPSVVVLGLHHVFGQCPQVVESTCVTRVQPGKNGTAMKVRDAQSSTNKADVADSATNAVWRSIEGRMSAKKPCFPLICCRSDGILRTLFNSQSDFLWFLHIYRAKWNIWKQRFEIEQIENQLYPSSKRHSE